jgi:hypothetical protein
MMWMRRDDVVTRKSKFIVVKKKSESISNFREASRNNISYPEKMGRVKKAREGQS